MGLAPPGAEKRSVKWQNVARREPEVILSAFSQLYDTDSHEAERGGGGGGGARHLCRARGGK